MYDVRDKILLPRLKTFPPTSGTWKAKSIRIIYTYKLQKIVEKFVIRYYLYLYFFSVKIISVMSNLKNENRKKIGEQILTTRTPSRTIRIV